MEMNKNITEIISKITLAEKPVRIKLLGDSITHGVGGTGFKQNGDPVVEGYSRNKDGYCWANLFKDYMERQFNAIVVNNGCTGTKIEFIINNFDALVDNDDDIIICTIGTNNRHQDKTEKRMNTPKEHMEEFYNNIIKLHSMFVEAKKDVIFVANIPASVENEKRDDEVLKRLFHMSDVNNLYLKASLECGFPFISMYSRFLEYCDLKGVSTESLLADGLHPNDNGHDVIFRIMLKELGIGRKL